MALINMQVFVDNARELVFEKLGQQIEKFNAASNNTLQLSSDGFSGDFFERSFYNSLAASRRRVDRYAANGNVSATALAQSKAVEVKVAGGFGPIIFEPSQMAWISSNPAEALNVISNSMTEAILQDQINSAIAALVAAISNQAAAKIDVSGSSAVTQIALNNTDAKFGDSSSLLVARIMRGATYHKLIGQNLVNAATLFNSGNVTVVDILGKPIIVTDAPALYVAGTPNKEIVLTLVSGAIVIGGTSDLITNVATTNGKERIETTFQGDYTFTMKMLGYSWDTANGGKSPTDAEIATGTNWDLFVTDIKHSAGVITIGSADL